MCYSYCSGAVALNRLVGAVTHPGVRSRTIAGTFAKVKAMKVDVLLEPHPEVSGMRVEAPRR